MDKKLLQAGQVFQDLAPQFTAFGDPRRQELFWLIVGGQYHGVQELAERMQLPRPTVSHHLKVLYQAGVISYRQVGNKRRYYPTLGPTMRQMQTLINMVNTFPERFHLHD